MKIENSSALICVDFINEIVDVRGKLAAKGYHDYMVRHNVLDNVETMQGAFRDSRIPIIHVRLGFSENYVDYPASSPLLGKARVRTH